VPLALRFSLDEYTNWYNSPGAAVYFWGAFAVALAIVIALMLWVFRRARPH
jgi:heme exporter protein D